MTTYVLPFLTIVVPLFGAAIAWILNEWRKRAWEDYQRREANYRELLIAMRGFYASNENKELKTSSWSKLIFVDSIVLTKLSEG